MALQVWLPLDGDLRNLGLSDLKFSILGSYTTVDNGGKIGKCYKNSTYGQGGIISNKTITLPVTLSWFCWINFSSLGNSSNLNGVVSNHMPTNTPANMGITIKYLTSTTGKLSCSTGNGTNRTYNTYTGNTTLTAGVWYHIGFTYNGSKIKFYVNGVLDGETSYTNQSQIAAKIGIFAWNMNSSSPYGYAVPGKLNDVRIYDHCLSEDEIHELSLGKVAHWCLDENSLNGQNLITSLLGGGQCTISGNTVNISGTNSDTYFYLKTSAAMESGKLYKISCTGSGFPSSAIYNFPIAGLSNTGPGQIKIKNGYCSMVFTANDTCANAGTTIIMDDTSRSAGAGTISNLRLVKLNKSCDISGNHNDLTATGNPTLSDDSVRYNKSTLFNGSNYLSCISPTAEAKTLSLWAYIGSIPTSSSVLFADYKSKLSLGFYNSGTLLITRCGGTSATLGTISSLVKTNAWNHFCVVNGTTNLLYINSLAATMSGSNNWTHSTDTLMVGMRSAGTGFANKISDVRLYATALSADDVLKLYKLGNV